MVVATLAAAGVVWITRRAPPFREVSDGAILEIYTLEALRGRLLLGPYSRFGWHHPGPLFFYLEAPWYWFSGRHTAGMQAGALAINLAAVLAFARIAAANATTPLAAALCGAMSWYVWRTGDMIVSPWNPHVVVLPLVAFIAGSAAFAASGHGALLPPLVAGASFLAQTHVAMAPPLALLLIVVAVAQRSAVRNSWRPAALVGFALWLPVIVEQAMHHPGNVTRLVSFFAEPAGHADVGEAARAWSAALTGVFRRDFAVARGFELRRFDTIWPTLWSAGEMVLLVVAARRAHARRDAFAVWMALMCGLTSIVAFVATTRIRDRIVDHEVFWMSALGAINIAAVTGAVASPIRFWKISPSVPAAILVAVTAVAGAGGIRQVLARPRTLEDHSVDALAESIERYVADSHVRRPLIHIDQPIWPIAAGALLLVHKHGIPFAVDGRWTTMFGDPFQPDGAEDGEVTITGSPRQPRIVVTP